MMNGGEGIMMMSDEDADGDYIHDQMYLIGNEIDVQQQQQQQQQQQLLLQQQQQQQQQQQLQLQQQDEEEYLHGNISEFLSADLHNFIRYIHQIKIDPKVYQGIISEIYHVKK